MGDSRRSGIQFTTEQTAGLKPYVSTIGAWALALGTSIGWGSLFVTSNSYLGKAGPMGTILGLAIGAVAMVIIGRCYHYLMNCFPDAGGAYTYTKEVFGYDQGFAAAWFLSLTYLSLFWANVSALPLFSRYFFGDFFRFGYLYTLFGSYEVYLGEALLTAFAILLFTFICARFKRLSLSLMIATVVIFTVCILVCTLGSIPRMDEFHKTLSPGFIPDTNELRQVMRIAAVSPWAFMGFENISHSTEEFTFPRSRSFKIITAAVITSAALYILVTILSVSAYPSEYASWLDYIRNHGNLNGLRGLPAFYAADYYLGDNGVRMLMAALLCLIVSSLIGNVVALSRLLYVLSKDSVLPASFSALSKDGVPSRAIMFIAAVSLFMPFIGRTAVGWIVDVTTFGATIVYGFVSASAYKLAGIRGDKAEKGFGAAGFIIMLAFGMFLLIPALLGAGELASETYFLFTIWAILGFLYLRNILRRDKAKRFGRAVIVWIVLLGMTIFTTLVWLEESTMSSAERSFEQIRSSYTERIIEDTREIEMLKDPELVYRIAERKVNLDTVDVSEENKILAGELEDIRRENTLRIIAVFFLFLLSVGVLLNNYSVVIKLAQENEYELVVAKEKANTDSLTGVKNKRTFDEYEKNINRQIAEGTAEGFSVVICDINGLKHINDNLGHKAGDELIRSACRIICRVFEHSPVFRIGGDEFVAILTGHDFKERSALMKEINSISEENLTTGDVVVAAGISDYMPDTDDSIRPVFDRADAAMYERKERLKEMGAVSR